MDRIEIVREQIKDIDKQISELSTKRGQLRKEENELFAPIAANNIGRCFKSKHNDAYYQIIDVPECGCVWYPVLIINEDDDEIGRVPFIDEEISMNSIDNGEYIEITAEEYQKKFDECIRKLTDLVGGKCKGE